MACPVVRSSAVGRVVYTRNHGSFSNADIGGLGCPNVGIDGPVCGTNRQLTVCKAGSQSAGPDRSWSTARRGRLRG